MTHGRVTTNFGDVIRNQLANDPDLAAKIENEAVNAHIAREVYRIRNEAKLTQKALGELVGTTQSVIARIEDAEYEGHSINLLKKIAIHLKKRIRVEFYDLPKYESKCGPVVIIDSSVPNSEFGAVEDGLEVVSTALNWQVQVSAEVNVPSSTPAA